MMRVLYSIIAAIRVSRHRLQRESDDTDANAWVIKLHRAFLLLHSPLNDLTGFCSYRICLVVKSLTIIITLCRL